jgi:ketosteroid isomerase-like protein
MYRTIVRQRVLHLMHEANRGNWQAIIDALDARFSYRFIGDTPLGGERSTKQAMAAWFERLYRLFPGAQFHPQSVVVEGMPWNTRVMTYVKIRGTQPGDGSDAIPYENEFMQLMTLRWGKITSIITLEDTLRFAKMLPKLASAGFPDASAPPITDEVTNHAKAA